MNKTLGIILVVVVVLVGGYLLTKKSNNSATGTTPNTAGGDLSKVPPLIGDNPSQGGGTETKGAVKEFTVIGSNFKFSLNEIRVKKGDMVKITFKNEEGSHDWVIDEFNAKTKRLQVGEQETIEFVANKVGTFEYYCSVAGHRKNGMKGNLIVEG